MPDIVNNFYARGEAEEMTIGSVSKTMSDILKSQVTFKDHREYHPISDEISYYVVKLL
jgi:hypothetical protein